jgi:hypothetical protein
MQLLRTRPRLRARTVAILVAWLFGLDLWERDEMKLYGNLVRTSTLCVFVSGCGGANFSAVETDSFEREVAGCLPAMRAEAVPSLKWYSECLRYAKVRYWTNLNLPHRDLLDAYTFQVIALSEAADQKKITRAEFLAAEARLNAEMVSHMQQRDTSAAVMAVFTR